MGVARNFGEIGPKWLIYYGFKNSNMKLLALFWSHCRNGSGAPAQWANEGLGKAAGTLEGISYLCGYEKSRALPGERFW